MRVSDARLRRIEARAAAVDRVWISAVCDEIERLFSTEDYALFSELLHAQIEGRPLPCTPEEAAAIDAKFAEACARAKAHFADEPPGRL